MKVIWRCTLPLSGSMSMTTSRRKWLCFLVAPGNGDNETRQREVKFVRTSRRVARWRRRRGRKCVVQFLLIFRNKRVHSLDEQRRIPSICLSLHYVCVGRFAVTLYWPFYVSKGWNRKCLGVHNGNHSHKVLFIWYLLLVELRALVLNGCEINVN